MNEQRDSKNWAPADYPRDTLVYAMGGMADAILDVAAGEPDFRRFYNAWFHQQQALGPDVEVSGPLMRVRAEGGFVNVLARNEASEFVLNCEHPRFSALVSARYHLERRELAGIWVVHFGGHIKDAINFAVAASNKVQRPNRPASPPESYLN